MDPIHANYERDGDDWTIKVRRGEKTLSGKAPGLIAARDRADQLVEKLAPDVDHPTVVHLLNGDALEFTTAYLNARMTPTEKVPAQPSAAEKAKPAAVPAQGSKKKAKEADQAKEAQPAPPA